MLSISADTVVVPLASEDDAATTANALSAAIDAEGRVVLLHVIEKAGGAPDKASVEQREDRAAEIFAVARDHLSGDRTIETEVRYGTDVADTIASAAEALDADLIAFSPREAGRLTRLLTGDTSLSLLTGSPVPMVVLPEAGE
ncbi:universal stress protein [Salinarchaeum laminariae]|uniref:universal stress protein n=1 Tax=Salinarchaeum laminariae TaxID=869888 RepID=UPI0020BDC122|nr:universal stress protein [Salinarchaeum laminariae]